MGMLSGARSNSHRIVRSNCSRPAKEKDTTSIRARKIRLRTSVFPCTHNPLEGALVAKIPSSTRVGDRVGKGVSLTGEYDGSLVGEAVGVTDGGLKEEQELALSSI